jgi:hypothetical protein
MSRKTRPPGPHEDLLDLPRHSERWVPVPARLKVAVCHLCGNWTIRRGENSITDERAVFGYLRTGAIRFRWSQSIGNRPVCETCNEVSRAMDLGKTSHEKEVAHVA